jgi:hypothetical protein
LKNLEVDFFENETVKSYNSGGDFVSLATISSEHTGKTSFMSIGAIPYLKWYFADVFFIKAGFEASYVFSSNVAHTQKFQQQTVKLSNGEIGILKDMNGELISDKNYTLCDETYPEASGFRFGVRPMIGFDIQIDRSLAITPIFQYNIPLTNVSSEGKDFRINSWSIIIELRHTLIEVFTKSEIPI